MSKPLKFIYTSDYATLQNDDTGTASITVPSNIGVSAGSIDSQYVDIVVGSPQSEVIIRISSSKLGASKFYGGMLGVNRTGIVSGSPTPYTIYAFVSRVSATTLRCMVMIDNGSAATLQGAAGTETFTFKVKTFVAPVV